MSKTVVMIVQSLPPLASGGAELQALRLSEILIKKQIDVIFITPGVLRTRGYTNINGTPVYRLHSVLNYFLDFLFFIQKKKPSQKTIIEFDDSVSANNTINRKIGWGSRLRYNIFLINAFFFLLKKRKNIGLLHSHTIEWPGYVSAVLSKWFKIKLLVKDSTMNGIYNILRFPNGEKKRSLLITQGNFIAMTKVIQQNFIHAGISKNKIFNIPNGIKIDSHFKQNFKGNTKVLFVGNLYQQPAKGIDILLKAWKLVIATAPEAILVIAGDGDTEAYKQYCNKLEIDRNVIFAGKQNDITSLMLEADIFVLPSRREGMPNVLMEAMLRSLPCIASDISGCQDLITNGENGMLVQVADIHQLANAILYLLNNRDIAEKMGTEARRTITSFFDMGKIADQYISLYNELTNTAP